MGIAEGPLILTIPMPPSPGGVEIAAIVSSRLLRVAVCCLLIGSDDVLIGGDDVLVFRRNGGRLGGGTGWLAAAVPPSTPAAGPAWAAGVATAGAGRVLGRDDDSADRGRAETERADVGVVLEREVDNAPLWGAKRLDTNVAAGFFCALGEMTRHLLEVFTPPIEIALNINDESFDGFSVAGPHHSVEQVLEGLKVPSFPANQDGGIGGFDVDTRATVFGQAAVYLGLDSHLVDNLGQKGGRLFAPGIADGRQVALLFPHRRRGCFGNSLNGFRRRRFGSDFVRFVTPWPLGAFRPLWRPRPFDPFWPGWPLRPLAAVRTRRPFRARAALGTLGTGGLFFARGGPFAAAASVSVAAVAFAARPFAVFVMFAVSVPFTFTAACGDIFFECELYFDAACADAEYAAAAFVEDFDLDFVKFGSQFFEGLFDGFLSCFGGSFHRSHLTDSPPSFWPVGCSGFGL